MLVLVVISVDEKCFNAAGEFVDLIKEGILDPLKVVRKVFIGATW